MCHLPQEGEATVQAAAAPDMVTTLSWAIEATTFRVMIVASVWCAQLYAQHMTYHPQSSVHPRTLVVVPVQQLTLNATCKWVVHTISDGGRVDW